MALVVNHNLMAVNAARNLQHSHDALSRSTRRLSSGLRVGTAADDAAGLSIRELMRAEIASLNQGVRNANDAVSMIQTADGALQVIDEKLIRLKELAEQAATGTYNSDQRQMIDQEFQEMLAEIDRIADATDFNGIKLLDGTLQGVHDGSGLSSTGAMKIHFGSGNDAAEDYYHITIGACDARSLLFPDILEQWPGARREGKEIVFSFYNAIAGTGFFAVPGMTAMDSYTIPTGLENVVMRSRNAVSPFFHKPHINLFTRSGVQLTGVDPQGGGSWWNNQTRERVIASGIAAGLFDPSAQYVNSIRNQQGQMQTVGGMDIVMQSTQSEADGVWEEIWVSEITSDLVFLIGGHNNPSGGCNVYDLEFRAEINTSINTQTRAQNMLERITLGILSKDAVRAHLGAMQNRLENTVANIAIQAENIQAAESRISDVDVASEMTEFIRRQVLAQSSTAMLHQANSLQHMALQILQEG